MITSLIEMLELPNFRHMTTSTIYFESRDNFFGNVIDINYDVITFISKYLCVKMAWGNHFCWHHRNFNFFIKKTFKDSRKVKKIRKFVSKCNLYMYFLISQNLLISVEKLLMSAELKGRVMWFTFLVKV